MSLLETKMSRKEGKIKERENKWDKDRIKLFTHTDALIILMIEV